jgi:hypothetical protein
MALPPTAVNCVEGKPTLVYNWTTAAYIFD